MKKLTLLALSALLTGSAFAQAPDRFNYQGIARNAAGQPVSSQALGLRLSVLDGSATGTAVYVETQNVTTNAYGLYSVQIGGGTVVSGTLAGVNWATGSKFLKVEVDPAGGTAYTTLGNSQLLSVPYAMYAGGTAAPTLTLTGNTLSAGANTITLPTPTPYTGGTGITVTGSTISASNLAGDVTGAPNTNTVTKIQGTSVSTTAPTSGRVLKFNGTAWAPGSDLDSQVLSITGNTLAISGGNSITLPTSTGVTGSGTTNYHSKFTSASVLGNSLVYDDGTNVSIGLSTGLGARLHVSGSSNLSATVGALTFNHQAAVFQNGTTSTTATANALIGYSGNSTVENHGMFGYAGATAGGSTYSVGGFFLGLPASTSTGNSYGVYGSAGSGANNIGIYGTTQSTSTGSYAGYFSGNVQVTGSIAKGSGTFKIDHPLDPENKYLYHSFVESPEMMNIYNGNITTDAAGYATVTMPSYFDALNKDFRYQLTAIGTFAQAIISKEIQGNQFIIQTSQPNVKVSWQVTGVRQDKYANAHRVEAEVEKEPNLKGHYLHAAEWGQPASRSIDAVMAPPSAKQIATPIKR